MPIKRKSNIYRTPVKLSKRSQQCTIFFCNILAYKYWIKILSKIKVIYEEEENKLILFGIINMHVVIPNVIIYNYIFYVLKLKYLNI